MSTSITKQGIIFADGESSYQIPNHNLVFNGDASEFNGTWTPGATHHWGNWGSASDRSIVKISDRWWFHCKSPASTTYGGFYQDQTLTNNQAVIKPNTNYTVSAIWFASAECSCRYWFHMRSSDGGANISQPFKNITVTTNPQRISFTFNSGTNADYTINRFNLMMGPVYTTDGIDVYFTEVKIEEGDEVTDFYMPGNNLVLNSYDYSGWAFSPAASWEVTTKDGYRCLHCIGEIGKSKYTSPKYAQSNATHYTPAPGEIITMSGYVLLDNVTLGDTNSYIYFYGSGKSINGWKGPAQIARTDKYISHAGWGNFDPDKCKDWIFVYVTWEYGDYDWSGICPNIYARDFSGDFYLRDFKIEIGSTPTPWTPNPNDAIYTGEHGFFEGSDIASIGKGYVSGREFYEM